MTAGDTGCILLLGGSLLFVILVLLWSRRRSRTQATPPTASSGPIADDTEAWLASRRATPLRALVRPPSWMQASYYGLKVVGTSHYQDALEAISGPRTDESVKIHLPAELILDDANVYDRQAVKVEISGRHVGYLSKEDARAFRARLQREGVSGARFPCPAEIVGGWEGGHYGVRLALALYS